MAKKLKQYKDVDIISFLEEKMNDNTVAYKTDFEYDRKMIQAASASNFAVDKDLFWMSRPHGTYCHTSNDVFQQDTFANHVWRYYDYEADKILAFAVRVGETRNKVVYGDVYEMDYRTLVDTLNKESVDHLGTLYVYQDGHEIMASNTLIDLQHLYDVQPIHGPVIHTQECPKDIDELRYVLHEHDRTLDMLEIGEWSPSKQEAPDKSLAAKLRSAQARRAAKAADSGKPKTNVRGMDTALQAR